MDSDERHPTNHPGGGWVTHNIVSAVLRTRDVEPSEMEPPLNDVINLDALEQVLDSADQYAEVAFHYQELEIIVRADGQTDVSDIAPEA